MTHTLVKFMTNYHKLFCYLVQNLGHHQQMVA